MFILYADVWDHGYGIDIRIFGCFPTIEEAVAFVLANDTISIGCDNNFEREEEFFSFLDAFARYGDEAESFEDYLKHHHIKQIVNGTATCIGGYVE